jgi:tetratricopeptide (TPR) repeat protein
VLFRSTPGNGAPAPVFDGVDPADDLVVQLALAGGPVAGTQVSIELRASGSQVPMFSRRARIAQTTAGQTVAHDALPAALLPPGRYVLSARIGETVLARALTVRAGAGPAPAVAPIVARPEFDLAAVLDPAVLDPALARLAGRPEAKARFSAALAQLRQGELDGAAAELRTLQQAMPEFAPALVYLGACYAAGGKDRDATSAWQRALAVEPSPLAQRLAIEAWLRAGPVVSAQALIVQARERWPADPTFARLQAFATLAEGRAADGLARVAALPEPDPPTLLLALATLYDAARRGPASQDPAAALEAMRRLRDRYGAMHGDALGRVDAWVAAIARGAGQ